MQEVLGTHRRSALPRCPSPAPGRSPRPVAQRERGLHLRLAPTADSRSSTTVASTQPSAPASSSHASAASTSGWHPPPLRAPSTPAASTRPSAPPTQARPRPPAGTHRRSALPRCPSPAPGRAPRPRFHGFTQRPLPPERKTHKTATTITMRGGKGCSAPPPGGARGGAERHLVTSSRIERPCEGTFRGGTPLGQRSRRQHDPPPQSAIPGLSPTPDHPARLRSAPPTRDHPHPDAQARGSQSPIDHPHEHDPCCLSTTRRPHEPPGQRWPT